MEKDTAYGMYCPICGLEAHNSESTFRQCVYRLVLPIFFCNSCHIVCVDRRTVRRILSEWRKKHSYPERSYAHVLPYEEHYQAVLEDLEHDVTSYWIATLGYKRARFKNAKQIEEGPHANDGKV